MTSVHSLLLAAILGLMTHPASADDSAPGKRVSGETEISIPAYITGGVLGTSFGFGIGHAVQGRYKERGWIFTALEGGSLALILVGNANCWPSDRSEDKDDSFDDWDASRPSVLASSCPGGPAIFAGIAGFIGFHIWEIVDLWAGPKFDHDRKKFYADGSRPVNIGVTALAGQRGAIPALSATWTY